MDSLLTALRVVVSLVVVVALVWYLARKLGHRGHDTSREAEVRVVDRQSLSKHAGVAVVAAGDRRLLVGFADQGVQLITELRPVPELPRVPSAASASSSSSSSSRAGGRGSAAKGARAAKAAVAKATAAVVGATAGGGTPTGAGGTSAAAGVPTPRSSATASSSARASVPVGAGVPAGASVPVGAGVPVGAAAVPTPAGPLAGSVLSPQTWQATLRAWQDRTVRR